MQNVLYIILNGTQISITFGSIFNIIKILIYDCLEYDPLQNVAMIIYLIFAKGNEA